jgi:hypothetical protein
MGVPVAPRRTVWRHDADSETPRMDLRRVRRGGYRQAHAEPLTRLS